MIDIVQVIAEIVQTIALFVSTIVAVTALYLTYITERRNQLRFEGQLRQSREIATANVKPFLTIHSQIYNNDKGIALFNGGVGTAVITYIEFTKEDHATRNLVELFNLGKDFKWDTFWRFSGQKYYLRAGEKYQLIRLTVNNLLTQGWSEEKALGLLSRWQEQKSGIKVRIVYEDILGNSIEPYSDTLN